MQNEIEMEVEVTPEMIVECKRELGLEYVTQVLCPQIEKLADKQNN